MADNTEIKEFQKYIIAEAQSQNKDPEAYIKELGEDGLKEAYKRYQAYKKKQTQKAAHGAKLQYFKSLKNKCAEDEELIYYKNGGNIDCGCVKKAQKGEKITKSKNAVEAFKCGQKIKKNQQGKKFPLIETDKNGKNKTIYYNDEATRDSIAANRYNDQEVQTMKPGSKKKNANGKVQWTPDRTKAPYNKKVTKHQQGGSFKSLFNNARKQGNRYFWYKGKMYNTRSEDESLKTWAQNFKDNSTTQGNNRIQTDVGRTAGWNKGTSGRYDDNGNWITFNPNAGSAYNAVMAVRGNAQNTNAHRAWGRADRF